MARPERFEPEAGFIFLVTLSPLLTLFIRGSRPGNDKMLIHS
jgi:hypothetical protein